MQEKRNLELMQFLDEFQQNHAKLVQGDHMNLLLSPLERIKIIFQVQDIIEDHNFKSGNQFQGGLLTCMGRLWEEQGFFELWKGFGAKLLKVISHNYFRKLFTFDQSQDQSPITSTLQKVISGLMALVISYPFDLIRVRMAADVGETQKFKGFVDCFEKISSKEGLKGMYWGLGAGALAIVSFRLSHDIALYLQNRQRRDQFRLRQSYLATTVGLIVSYPFQTVKNRMILMAGRDHKPYTSTLDCIEKITEQEGGFFCLYKGFSVEIKNFLFTISSLIVIGGIAMATLLSFVGRNTRQRLLEQIVDQVEKKVKQQGHELQGQQQSNRRQE